MVIAIDCRMYNASGIGVYLRGCLPHLLQTHSTFILIGDLTQLQSFSSSNVSITNCNIKPFSIREIFFFPFSVLKQIKKAQFFFSPSFNIPGGVNIPVFTTIHDIIFPDMPQLVSKAGLAIRMWFFKRAYKKSKKIFTVSEYSKSRIQQHLGFLKPVIVTYSAILPDFLNYRNAIQYNTKKNETIIFIGNIKKHKGLDYLLSAFLLARKEGLRHNLIIIGAKENFRTADNSVIKKIESLQDGAVLFTGQINNEELMHRLASASLLVQPSLYEGFCLPPLEAMVLGTKALITDIPVLREIYSGYPVSFFLPGESIDLKEKLMELLFNKKPSFIKLNNDLLLKYSFEKTASIIYKELS